MDSPKNDEGFVSNNPGFVGNNPKALYRISPEVQILFQPYHLQILLLCNSVARSSQEIQWLTHIPHTGVNRSIKKLLEADLLECREIRMSRWGASAKFYISKIQKVRVSLTDGKLEIQIIRK